ncbi:winged helix-turn-helix domain-containing protein [Streptomyces sp. NRRL S-350]|uniref:winged helix-turn-helix domain-containing protein n=1 Tax=Streptomyces sp. NRRL S-350 TaxID=1463902 RepID=UPI0007C5AC2C|nr:winged helix-turn-helix domain-containing protein [Streptomyces sp. NRRL S-350]
MRTELHFSASDLALTRFAVSPMQEVVTSLRAVACSPVSALHRRWAGQVRERLATAGPAMERLAALVPPTGHLPDFLNPAPAGFSPTLTDELAAITATGARQVRADLDILAAEAGGRLPGALAPLHRDPAAHLPRLAADIEAYWALALAPYWARIRALLAADVFHRSRQAAEHGTARMLGELHDTVRWDGTALLLEQRHCAVTRLNAGSGLLLLPSVFAWPRVLTRVLPPDPPQLIYPARGTAALWERQPEAAGRTEALAGVLGRSRARLLSELDSPGSTTELAHRTGLSPAGVSQHLTALRAAGLTSAHRAGHAVLHARTAVGDSLFGQDGQACAQDAPHPSDRLSGR